ncbi:helix-hairpin-helix domain-containing protein [Nocardiopsis coralli]|nr:helix-hairpin-helix domain-containing protein [Nocardiopsis coralli]
MPGHGTDRGVGRGTGRGSVHGSGSRPERGSGGKPGRESESGSERSHDRSPDLSLDPRLWNEPPISAQVLRHHLDLTPDTLPSGVPGTVPFGNPGSAAPGPHGSNPFGLDAPSGVDQASGVDRVSESAKNFDPNRAHGAFGMPGLSVTPDAIAATGPTGLPGIGTSASPANAATTGTTAGASQLGTGAGTPPSTRSEQDELLGGALDGTLDGADDLDGPDELLEGGGTVRLRPRNGSGAGSGSGAAFPSPAYEGDSAHGTPPAGSGDRRPSGPASRAARSYGTVSSAFRAANRPAATFDDMFPGPRFPGPADQGFADASVRAHTSALSGHSSGAGSGGNSNTSAPSDASIHPAVSGRSPDESTVRIPASGARRGPAGSPATSLGPQGRHDPQDQYDRQDRQSRPHRPDHQHPPDPPDTPDRRPTTPRTPTTRKWVGHRPLSEQPREYRRPSWPADPPSDPRSDPASGSTSHDRASEHHPADDPTPDGPWNPSFDAWPERDPDDSVTVPGSPANHGDDDGDPGIHIPPPPDSPWLDPDDEELLKERRPPSGYVEFDPRDPADAPVTRLARMWGPNATLSKRAVIALFVLGAAAVVAALFFLRREPAETDVPEMVPQSAPDGENGNGNGAEGSGGDGDAAEGSGDASDAGTEDGSGEDVVVHIGGDVEDPGLYTLPPGSRVLDAVEEAGGALPDADLDMVNLARPVVDGERILLGAEGDPEAAEAAEGGDAERVSLNQADQSALEALPGIGEAKAGAILEHRESLGGSFSSVEDLLDVSGIGQSTFDNLEDHVTL